MLTDKNTEILDTEEKYRSGLAEDPSWVHPSKKYKEATKAGIVIPPEMKIKHYEEIGKDTDALQTRDPRTVNHRTGRGTGKTLWTMVVR